MERREFLGKAASGFGMAAILPWVLQSSVAQAESETPDGFTDYPGYDGHLKYKVLWSNHVAPDFGTASCTLLIADAGVEIPPHVHPQGEFLYVIDGSLLIDSTYADGRRENVRYVKGDSLWAPANTVHHNEVSEGAKVLVFAPHPFVKI